MDETANLNLIGHSVAGNKRLRSIEAVADFICKHGKYGDVKITSNGENVIREVKRMLIDSFNQRIQKEKNNDKKGELPIQGID